MSTLLATLTDMERDGLAAFGDSRLGEDSAGVISRIGRRRTVRAVGTGAASAVLVGAVAAGAWAVQTRGTAVLPGVTASESATPAPSEAPPVETFDVTLRGGVTVEALAEDIADSGVSNAEFLASLEAALPPQAEGNPEGWAAPGDYTVTGPQDLAEQAVARTLETLAAAGVAPEDQQQILTVASLITNEVQLDEYRPLVAAVIYNRLEIDLQLQLDSTIKYLVPDHGEFTTPGEREIDSPYNTYIYRGLPPGPIGAPSVADIEAAVNPADGDWVFFVTVNLETGETLFAADFEEHQDNVRVLMEWFTANETVD